VAAVLLAPAAQAIELNFGEVTGTLDTTISYGYSQRLQDQADNLIGKARFNPLLASQIATLQSQGRFLEAQQLQIAAQGRFSVNRDDGNLKYDSGDAISSAFKINSELALNYENSGVFARAVYFYDFENNDRDDLTEEAKDLIGSRFRLLDAFAFTNFTIGENINANVRVGRQVISWGESTFIQGGINVINAVDLSALRVAGAELKEAFLPLDAVYASFGLTENLSIEATYLLEFEEIEIDAAGTYFSANDFAAPGGTYVMLGFGTVPQPVENPELYGDVCLSGAAGFTRSDNGLPSALVGAGCGASFPRAPTVFAKDSGQFGLAMRYFASELNDTEFGFYYLRYHSRVPVLSGISVTSTNLSSGRYFLEYPEDIDLYGVSWNTSLPYGVAWQGELTYRDGVPLQIDDVELLFAGLTPLNSIVPQPGLRFSSQLGSFGVGQYIQSWERHELSQLQSTFTKLFGPNNFLGAEAVAAVLEIGGTNVWDLPDPSVLRYEGEGSDTGGGFDIATGALRNPQTLDPQGFPTKFSWGYRLAFRADYNNVFGSPINVSPRLAFNHDVNGSTPGPGGNFLEGRKSATIGAEATYLNSWAFDLSWTIFTGGKPFNQIYDRDFASVSIKYSF